MASNEKKLGSGKHHLPNGAKYRFGLVVSDYYFEEITQSLFEKCKEVLLSNHVKDSNIESIFVPGTFELAAGALLLAEKEKFDAIVCIGCVIKGDTDHDKYINHAIAQSLVQLNIRYKIPFIFGVLTPNNMQQALDRSGGKLGNKGEEAAIAALRMAALYEENS